MSTINQNRSKKLLIEIKSNPKVSQIEPLEDEILQVKNMAQVRYIVSQQINNTPQWKRDVDRLEYQLSLN